MTALNATTYEFDASALRAAGAVRQETVQIGNRKAAMNFVPLTKQQVDVAADAPQIQLAPDQNDLRKAHNPTPQFSPRMALNNLLAQAARNTAVPAGLRAEITNWQRRERIFGRNGRSFSALQMKMGRALVAKLPATVVAKADPDHELRFSIGKQAPTTRNDRELNKHFRAGMENMMKRSTVNAQTIKAVPTANLRTDMFTKARALSSRNMTKSALSAALKGPEMTPMPIAMTVAKKARGMERKIEGFLGIASRPQPNMGRGRRPQNALALN